MAIVAKLCVCMYVCTCKCTGTDVVLVHTYLHTYPYMGSYFAHLSILPFLSSHKFYYRRSMIEKRVLLYPESRSVRRNTRQALDPPWSIHILKGHTDNPQVPAILPARLDAVRSSYFRFALGNRQSIICWMNRAWMLTCTSWCWSVVGKRHSRSAETC